MPNRSLSARENEVVALAAQGFRTKEIANALTLTVDTVKTHFRRVFRKIGVRSRAELVAWWCAQASLSAAVPQQISVDADGTRRGRSRLGQARRLALAVLVLLLAVGPLTPSASAVGVLTTDKAKSAEFGRTRWIEPSAEHGGRAPAACADNGRTVRGELVQVCSESKSVPDELPTIDVVSPREGASVTGPDVIVEIIVTEFVLTPPTGGSATSGIGHVIYYLDFEPAVVPGKPPIPPDPSVMYAVTHQVSHTFEEVAPGPHNTVAILVYDDHTPVMPPTIHSTQFTVLAPGETPVAEPSPKTTEIGRTVTTEEATPASTFAFAVLPAAQFPTAGDEPSDSGGDPLGWPLPAVSAGLAALGAGSIAVVRRQRRRPH